MNNKKGKRAANSVKRKPANQRNDIDATKKYKPKKKAGKGKQKLKNFFKRAFIVLIILGIIFAGVIAGMFFGVFGDDFKVTQDDLLISNMNTIIKDKDGEVVGTLSGDENRNIVSKSDMPEYLPKAFVSIEDERFYKHHGVDIKRTAAATVTYVFNRGKSSFGGSTITQQLIKNMTNEKDDSGVKGMFRKVKEMAKAYQVEKLISKDQILELYLNIIFLGDKAYGVEVASQYYFSKSVGELDLAECAFLAGINHMPNNYNPFKEDEKKETRLENIKTRTKTVLAKMQELGEITNNEEYNAAIAEVEAGLAFKQGNISSSATGYSYHTSAAINQAIKQLKEEKGWSEEFARSRLFGGGYTIYSTQDTAIQSRMEEEFKKDKYVVKSKKDKDKHSQAAMVLIDHTTGKVLGTVGGLGEDSSPTGWNRATQHKKQTGSAMKPLAVIAPALDKGIITAGTVYVDCPTEFDNGKYAPKNFYSGYKGLSTVRDIIEVSQNIPEVKIMTELGPENSIKFLKNMGIDLDIKKDANLSLALGGLTEGLSPLQMAAAYATIANGGEYIQPTFYTRIDDRHGKPLVKATQEKKRVMSEQNAYVEKSILTEPVKGKNGTATYCVISGIDVAAKTGTTNDDFDRWLCEFTPYYTAATWYGYDENETVRYSGNPAGKISSAIMKDVHKDLEKKTFEKPAGIETATICRTSGLLATDKCSDSYSEVFVKGTTPTKKCDGHISLEICKDTGKIANEYCPNKEIRIYTQKPEKEEKGKWKSDYGDMFNAPTATCTVHIKQEASPVEQPKEEKPKVDNTTSGGGHGGNDKPNENTTDNKTGGNSGGGNDDGNTNTEVPEPEVPEGPTE